MYRSFLKDQMKRKKLREKDAAEKIGIPVPTLKRAMNNEPVDQEAVSAICQWLELPNSPLFTSEDERVAAGVDLLSEAAPEFLSIFKTAGEDVLKGELNEEEFRKVVAYALTRFRERAEKVRKNAKK